jgi:hypothetical protein
MLGEIRILSQIAESILSLKGLLFVITGAPVNVNLGLVQGIFARVAETRRWSHLRSNSPMALSSAVEVANELMDFTDDL